MYSIFYSAHSCHSDLLRIKLPEIYGLIGMLFPANRIMHVEDGEFVREIPSNTVVLNEILLFFLVKPQKNVVINFVHFLRFVLPMEATLVIFQQRL